VTLATLTEAIDWASSRWANQRTVPTRLHTRDQEGTGLMRDEKGCKCLACTPGGSDGALGSHAHTNAFAAALDGKPDLIEKGVTRTVTCWHPLLPKGMSPRDCPECLGVGLKDQRTDLYAFPMTLALNRLRNGLASRRQPHPYGLVIVLASHGWLPEQAARSLGVSWDRAEALFLMALRRLHSHYAEGPVRTTITSSTVKWTDLSSSQQNAIVAGETAA